MQVFAVSGGRSVVVWDRPTLEKWKVEYKPGIAPLDYAAPGVNRVVRVPLEGRGDRVVYDFNADRLEHVSATQEPVSLRLQDAVTGLYYVGLDRPKMQETIAKVRKVHERMRTLKFDAAP